MKYLPMFALVVLASIPAHAQPPPAPRQGVELELLELEQDADKTILREALVFEGRRHMKAAPDFQPEKKKFDEDSTALQLLIDAKKKAIIDRSAELTKIRATSRRSATSAPASPVDRPVEPDRKAVLEKYEKAQIEVRLLEAQEGLFNTQLNAAVHALAAAEFEASNDETKRAKADAARKEYEKVKAKYVEQSLRLHLEQAGVQSMQRSGLTGGFGGGMR